MELFSFGFGCVVKKFDILFYVLWVVWCCFYLLMIKGRNGIVDLYDNYGDCWCMCCDVGVC